MDACLRPQVDYPCRVPLKVIGRGDALDPRQIADLIRLHLGPQADPDQQWSTRPKGSYFCHTFWITLPDEHAELPLRTAVQALPGYVMQM